MPRLSKTASAAKNAFAVLLYVGLISRSSPSVAAAATRTFRVGEQGYDGGADAAISDQNKGYTGGNGLTGRGETLGCYRIDGPEGYQTRVLLRFGKLSLPAGARVTAASLTLTFDNWSTGFTVRGRYLKVSWDPASKRLGWLHRDDQGRWATPGTGAVGKDLLDGPGFEISSFSGKGEERFTVDLSPGVVAAWVKDPAAAQRGVLLVNEAEGKVTRIYSFREKEPGRRPLLSITYEGPGEVAQVPASAASASSASLGSSAASGSLAPLATTSSHPRLLFSRDNLPQLAARAKNSGSFARLRARCDAYLGGTVEWPDGNRYPGGGSIGEGYQGSDYFEALLNDGLCYQMARFLAPDRAVAYGKKGAEILAKMSESPGTGAPHSVDPLRDSGFGIRFYGVGLALGYDWLYDALAPALRARLVVALSRWISAYEQKGFGRDHPQGNYFAGYYAAKALAALATSGDTPSGEAQWQDFLTRVHRGRVQPYYAAHLRGGGWPEGWNYGPLAMMNMALPALAAKTARGIDLVHDAGHPFLFPVEQGPHLIHFTWPDRRTLDDRHIQFGGENPSRAQPDLFAEQAGILSFFDDPTAPVFHRFARAVRKVLGDAPTPWVEALFWDDGAREADFATLPRSYLAPGIGAAALRSSWDTDAVWGTFAAGTYVNNPDSGEQYYDQGSLVIVRGGRQLLVNAVGALSRHTPGTEDGARYDDLVYNDLYNKGNRTLFNIFYVNRPAPPMPYGQAAIGPEDAHTRMSRFEDGGDYVVLRGEDLQDMYRGKRRAVTSWTRDVIYLRPQIFIVSDRTSIGDGEADQWMAFHLPRNVVSLPPPCLGGQRFDVGKGADFAGGVTTLLPQGQGVSKVDLFGRGKVFRMEIRPRSPGKDQRWLTIFDAARTRGEVAPAIRLSVRDGNVEAGAVVGTLLSRPEGNQVVLLPEGEVEKGEVRYRVPTRATAHLLSDVAPDTFYTVRLSPRREEQIVSVSSGGSLRSSHAGVLRFHSTPAGEVSP